MLSLLDAIENSGWATFLRDANTVFAYATVLALHTFGMILVVGISVAFALRTLGFAPDLPLAPLRKYVPLMWVGLYVNAATGVLLFLIDGRHFATNLDFWIKMLSIVGAVTSLRLLLANLSDPTVVDTRPVPTKGRVLAGSVLTFWLVAITAGRLTAYDPFIQRQSALAVLIVVVVAIVVGRFIGARLLGADRPAGQDRIAAR